MEKTLKKTMKFAVVVATTATMFGCATGGGRAIYSSDNKKLPIDAKVGIVYSSEQARAIDARTCDALKKIHEKRTADALADAKEAPSEPLCQQEEARKEKIFADALRGGAERYGAANTRVVDGSNIPADMDYLVYMQKLNLGCKPASESAGTIASGAALAGVTAAFLPLSIGYTAYNNLGLWFTAVNDEGKQVGTGSVGRTGGRLVTNCDKMLDRLGEDWAEKIFEKKK